MKYGAWFVVATALVGCSDSTSLGALDGSSGSDGGSGAVDSSDGSGGASSGSPTTGTPTTGTPTTGESSTDGPGTTGAHGTTGETGGAVTCDEPGTDPGCLPEDPPCGETCGQAQSQFDPTGCIRAGCSNDDGCAAGQKCFVGLDFGLCEGSGLVCEYDEGSQMCLCTSNPDCNGGHCIPEELYPLASPGPTGVMYVNNDCGPDDGPITVFRWLAQDADPGCGFLSSAPVELVLQFEGVLAPGVFAFGALEAAGAGEGTYLPSGNGSDVPVASATVTVDDVGGGVVSGSYTATIAGPDGFVVLSGDFLDTTYCETMLMCG